MSGDALFEFGIMAPMILMALTVHEAAHAWTARLFGDPTADRMGRVSLNPLVHLDLMGTLAFVICGFGWAKPVPYNRDNLVAAHPQHARWTELGVAAAGPLSNLLLAGICRLVLAAAVDLALPLGLSPNFLMILVQMMVYGVLVNAGLFVFNLLPIHPLDGFTVLRNALPLGAALRFQATRAYGGILLLGLILASRAGHFSLIAPAQEFLAVHLYRLGGAA